MSKMIPVVIDGQTYEVEDGAPLIEACFAAGKMVPHYCYHSGLSVSGNCRMCLVMVEGMPKAVTACTTPVKMQMNRATKEMEPMTVHTEGPDLATARAAIMEFLLVNHPLDCPQCDQAGECTLQDYAYTHGTGHSRFIEEKNQRHTKNLGPTIKLYGNRCIACSRCVRFCNEIVGTGELCLRNRGDKTVIDVFPELPLDNPMSMNVADVCPVGALLSRDFLFKERSWFMSATPTIMMNAHGDNAYVDSRDGVVKRLRGRYNGDVNDWWIADQDRLNYKFVAENRLTMARAGGMSASTTEAIKALATHLKQLRTNGEWDNLAVAVSAWMSNEELHLLKQLFTGEFALSDDQWSAFATPDQKEWVSRSGWTIPTDTNPNREGLRTILGLEAATENLATAATSGATKHLLVIGGIPNLGWPDALEQAIDAGTCVTLFDGWNSAVAEKAAYVVPMSVPFEKDGSYINIHGRLQRARRAVPAPTGVADLTESLQSLHTALHGQAGAAFSAPLSVQAVFTQMAAQVEAFAGITWGQVGLAGVALTTPEAAVR